MPSSRSRRRRAQQRRGPGPQQTLPRPRTGTAPEAPAAEPEDVLESAAPVEREDAAERDAILEAEVRRPVDQARDTAGDEDDLEPDEDLEAQEADVAAAELRDGDEEEEEADEDDGAEDEPDDEREADEDPEPAPALARRTPGRSGTALAERTGVRRQNRNRRRAAAPQPQGPALVRFFRETFDELRKVDWPNGSELYRYTLIVIITVIVLAAFISGIDWGLQQLAEKFVYGSSTGVTG